MSFRQSDFEAASFGELLAKAETCFRIELRCEAKGIREADVAAEAEQVPLRCFGERFVRRRSL